MKNPAKCGTDLLKERIYVCHTYYHVYIACLKELYLPEERQGRAALVLSTMSNDFGGFEERVRQCGLFGEVYMFEEKKDTSFVQLQKYHKDRGNIVVNMLARIRYTKLLGKLQEPYVPVDFREYKDIYVFCDSDPRSKLEEHLSQADKDILMRLFIRDMDGLRKKLDCGAEDKILVLSEPLCDLQVRKRIFSDIIKEYGEIDGQKCQILIKPHPRDILDYAKEFPELVILDGMFPMEILNFIPGLYFKKVVSVFTVPDAIHFAEEIVLLGKNFMDQYEAPELHRQDEMI